ncbi:MAG: hypothetical protein ABSE51_01340 [Terracidiphilus sp.]|jgi:hypothetical protein
MGQYDSPAEAALARIKSESLSSSSVDGAVEKVATLGGIILEAIGFTGASSSVRFLSTLKSLAANKDEGNLIYFGEALIDDIRRLYRLYEGLKQRFDERINSSEFTAVVANATLHITRTNVEKRLKRLAHLIANGVKEGDLEPESLDDMMRAAVELKESDTVLLGKIYESQKSLLKQSRLHPSNWFGLVQTYWNQFVDSGALDASKHLAYRSSFSRLESHGLIQKFREISTAGVGLEHYALLEEGLKFYEGLQEIAAQQ